MNDVGFGVKKMQDIGAKISQIRRLKGVSIVKFAEMLGVTRPTIYDLERGAPSTKMILYIKAAEALGCELRFALDVPVDLEKKV